MGRKIMIAIACVCMLLMSTCVTFAAPVGYTVHVAGKAMTIASDGSETAYYVNGASGAAGTVTNTEPDQWNGKLSYDAGEQTLVFEMRDLDVAENGIKSDHDIKMIVKGDNSIKGTAVKTTTGFNAYGIYIKGNLKISDDSTGVLEVHAGDIVESSNWSDHSRGIYAEDKMVIEAGVIKAYGGSAVGDFSYGMGAYNGIEITGGDVTAVGGEASYSVGLYSDWDLTIGGDAVVHAASADEGIDTYSYGTFVFGSLLVKDDAYFKSVAGKVNEGSAKGTEKRSFGIYLGESASASYDTSYVGGSDKLQIVGGTVIAGSEGSEDYRSYAIVFYDADKIAFTGADQDDENWYQWKINESDKMTKSSVTAYPDAEKWQSATKYFHVEPVGTETSEGSAMTGSGETPDTGDDSMVAVAIVGILLACMGMAMVSRKVCKE